MKIFTNLAISIDGKIADLSHPARSLGTPKDRQRMKEIRALSEAVLVGATTLRVHPQPIKARGINKRPILNAVVTRSGELDPAWPFWKDPSALRFVFTTRAGFRAASETSMDRAFIVLCGDEDVNPKKVVEVLKSVGVKNLLIEGGSEIMRLFLDHKLIDELYVTLTPKILGGVDNPTLVSGVETLSPWVQTRILECKKIGDEVYLHYKVK